MAAVEQNSFHRLRAQPKRPSLAFVELSWKLISGVIIALFSAFSVIALGCAHAHCDLSASLALDTSGQNDATSGNYQQSVSDFEQSAQGLATCADAISGDDHYRTLFQEASALSGEARSLFQMDDTRAQDIVTHEMSILRQLADDPNAEVPMNPTSTQTVRGLARAQVEPTSGSIGLPLPTPDFVTADAAQKHCPSDLVVYVEWPSPYFYPSSSQTSPARNGAFACKGDATAADYLPSGQMEQ